MFVKNNYYIGLAIFVLFIYFLSLHRITGGLGGLVAIFTGWLLPLLFLFFLAKFRKNKLESNSIVVSKYYVIKFMLICASLAFILNLGIYFVRDRPLDTVKGDEGCMCMYFANRGRDLPMTKINNLDFFISSTESFIQGFHVFSLN